MRYPEIPLVDVSELIVRGISPKYADIGYTIVNQKCIRGGMLDFSFARKSCPSKTVRSDKFLKIWDGVVNSTGVGTLGRVAQVCNVPDGVTVDSHVTIVRPRLTHLDGRFFGVALRWREPVIETLGVGATGQTELSRERLGEVTIPVPSAPTQKKIAAILSAYDDLIENNERRIKILEDMAQNLYREWFVNFRFPGHAKVKMVDSPLGKIPQGWEVSSIGELTSLLNRGISPKYDDSSDHVVINQKCIRNRQLSLTQSRKHNTRVPEGKQIQFGDVLINSTGVGTLGRVAQVYVELPKYTVDSHVTIVRPVVTKINVDYFGLALLDMETAFERMGTGATNQTELGRQRIGESLLLSSPQALQAVFSDAVRPVRSLLVNLCERNVSLRQTRDLLLPKLISGEVDVSELDVRIPEDAA